MGDFQVELQDGGLQKTAPSAFMKTGIVFGSVAATGLALGDVSDELSRIEDAEALGMDAAFDVTNEVLVWYHIKEFFRMNDSGKLRVMLVAQGVTMEDMCDIANPYAKKLIDDTNGELRRVGVVLNPATGYVPVLVGGFDEDVILAIPKAQELGETVFDGMRPIQICIEGREFNGTVAAAQDLRLTNDQYVMVTALQDPAAVTAFSFHEQSAAVGTTLGMMSFVNLNESIGWVLKGNLIGEVDGEFSEVNLSNNALASTVEADFGTLTEKGITFGRNYPAQAGVYFDDYPSLALLTSDYAYMQEVAVINDSVRRIYDQLFPRINGPVLINPGTGQISTETAKEIQADAGTALDVLVRAENISGYDVFVDPEQDIQTTGILEVQFSIVSIATGRTILVKIGFAKSI